MPDHLNVSCPSMLVASMCRFKMAPCQRYRDPTSEMQLREHDRPLKRACRPMNAHRDIQTGLSLDALMHLDASPLPSPRNALSLCKGLIDTAGHTNSYPPNWYLVQHHLRFEVALCIPSKILSKARLAMHYACKYGFSVRTMHTGGFWRCTVSLHHRVTCQPIRQGRK